MEYTDAHDRITDYRRQIASIREQMRAVMAEAKPEPVHDYEFHDTAGPVRLTELFRGRDDLILIHNMGASCRHCTLWADGYNGLQRHVLERAAFVVTSPDKPESQRRLAESRGWTFPMVSHAGTSFAQDMGYKSAQGGFLPGVSVLRRHEGAMVRVSDAGFSPGDDFCALWHFFDLLEAGRGNAAAGKGASCCSGS
jgi:predicted dithiol-disulfide oxidoreductase (DUF899 family)